MLTDLVVEEFSHLREQLQRKDETISALTRRHDALEAYVLDLKKWGDAAHEDLLELRKVNSARRKQVQSFFFSTQLSHLNF
jgi:hypothetical protein